jgi:hypothetical protein
VGEELARRWEVATSRARGRRSPGGRGWRGEEVVGRPLSVGRKGGARREAMAGRVCWRSSPWRSSPG